MPQTWVSVPLDMAKNSNDHSLPPRNQDEILNNQEALGLQS